MRVRASFVAGTMAGILTLIGPSCLHAQVASHLTLDASLGSARIQPPPPYASHGLGMTEFTVGLRLRSSPGISPILTLGRGYIYHGQSDDVCYSISETECANNVGFRTWSLLAGVEQRRTSGVSLRVLTGVGHFRWAAAHSAAVNAVRVQANASAATSRSTALVASLGYAWPPGRQVYDVPLLLMSFGLRLRSP